MFSGCISLRLNIQPFDQTDRFSWKAKEGELQNFEFRHVLHDRWLSRCVAVVFRLFEYHSNFNRKDLILFSCFLHSANSRFSNFLFVPGATTGLSDFLQHFAGFVGFRSQNGLETRERSVAFLSSCVALCPYCSARVPFKPSESAK